MNILAIDTANDVLSVAISKNDKIVAAYTSNIKKDHSSRLMPALVDLMEEVSLDKEDLQAIVVGNGPGSYTGTRIGVTTAKTLAWALNIPLYPISSLAMLAYNGVMRNGYIAPFFDARRQTVFTALYYTDGKGLREVKSERNTPMQAWLEELKELDEEVILLSPQIENFAEMIQAENNENLQIAAETMHLPNPANLIMLQRAADAVATHTVTPNYLRITEAEAKWLAEKKGVSHEG